MFNGGNWDQWLPTKTTTCMAHMQRSDLPFHYALADAFTVCDGYYCSVLGPTDPNRYYMWTGWDGNDGQGGGPVIANDELGYGWQTYPERLQAAGISWKIYQDIGDGLDAAHFWGFTSNPYIGNFGDNSLLYFFNYQNAAPGSPLYERARTGTDVKTQRRLVRHPRRRRRQWAVAERVLDCRSRGVYRASGVARRLRRLLHGRSARRADEQPRGVVKDGTDHQLGRERRLLRPSHRAVPQRRRRSPASRRSRSTTSCSVARPGHRAAQTGSSAPYGLGVRVPLLVVSPWSKGGWVCSEVFDHTSVIRFIEARFGVDEPNITPWRRAVCGDLTSAFDFESASDRVPPLPSVDAYKPDQSNQHPQRDHPVPPAVGSVPTQEPGVRPFAPARLPLRRRLRRRPRQAQARRRERRQARRSPPGTIANGPRRALQLHDRRRRRADAASSRTRAPTTSASTARTASSATSPVPLPRRCGSRNSRPSEPAASGSDSRPAATTGGRSSSTSPTPTDLTGRSQLHGTRQITIDTRHSGGWYDIALSTPSDASFGYQLAGRLESRAPVDQRPATRPLVAFSGPDHRWTAMIRFAAGPGTYDPRLHADTRGPVLVRQLVV